MLLELYEKSLGLVISFSSDWSNSWDSRRVALRAGSNAVGTPAMDHHRGGDRGWYRRNRTTDKYLLERVRWSLTVTCAVS